MKVLVYRYNSICEPDIIATFQLFGFEVDEYTLEMTQKDLPSSVTAKKVSAYLQTNPVDFVFSINFYPMLSEVCNIFHIRYVSWVVDAPVLELFASSITNAWNRTFIFDKAVYDEVYLLNPSCVYYLPLAARTAPKEELFSKAEEGDKKRFSHDVAFVGSLYSEKNPFADAVNLPDRLKGYLDGLMRAQLKVYGYYFIEELLSDNDVEEYIACCPNFYKPDVNDFLTDKKVLAQQYIGNQITVMERAEIFHKLSERFDVSIYTASDTSEFPKLHNWGRAKTLTEMPLIFHQSKININPTAKGIRSGIPLRIFDILSAGGFVLTNYQVELPELFEIGQDLAVYTSIEELIYLTEYYLAHENERQEIAACGYTTLKAKYTYEIQLSKMMTQAFAK